MRYSHTTKEIFKDKARRAIQSAADNVDNIHVHIAKGNKKVGRVWNVSTMPIITCGNCRLCEDYCYDIKACIQYTNVMTARAENTALATCARVKYFEEIKNRLNDRIQRKYFRWHVGGEILDDDYLRHMVEIACERPLWRFWTYTKMYDIVNRYIADGGFIPDNLKILFSADKNAVVDNPYGFQIAYTVVKGDTIPDGFMVCPGNCEICIDNQRGCPFGDNVAFNEH